MTDLTEGWQQLHGSKKFHYFGRDRRSLCGGWMTLAREFYQGNDESPDNCAACRKKRALALVALHHDAALISLSAVLPPVSADTQVGILRSKMNPETAAPDKLGGAGQ